MPNNTLASMNNVGYEIMRQELEDRTEQYLSRNVKDNKIIIFDIEITYGLYKQT